MAQAHGLPEGAAAINQVGQVRDVPAGPRRGVREERSHGDSFFVFL